MAAEYVMASGNQDVVLCERGIRTFETATRNTLDVAAIPVLKEETHLPVIVDPSHAGGRAALVAPLAFAAIAAGADGLIVEVHPHPEDARSDGDQSLDFAGFAELMTRLAPFAEAAGRTMHAADARAVARARVTAPVAHRLSGRARRVQRGGDRGISMRTRCRCRAASSSMSRRRWRAGAPTAGLLPIENTLAGSVVGSYDALAACESLHVVAETVVEIHHCVLAPRGATLAALASGREPSRRARPVHALAARDGRRSPRARRTTPLARRATWRSERDPRVGRDRRTRRRPRATRSRFSPRTSRIGATTRRAFCMVARAPRAPEPRRGGPHSAARHHAERSRRAAPGARAARRATGST